MRIPALPRRANSNAAARWGHESPPAPSPVHAEHAAGLAAQRERLIERFALLQSELGGTFYEMAIRDHIRIDVLMRKSAELQRVDAELSAVEHLLHSGPGAGAGNCPACGAVHARGAAFCGQCGKALAGQ